MDATSLPSRAARFAPWIAGAVLALPVLIARYPPMLDLPLHEAVVGLLRHWGDPSFVPPNVYALNLGHPNQAFYFAILALAYMLPIALATKLVVAVTLFLLPVSAARLADHLGAARWTALLVAPVGLGWMFFYGLLANLMGLALYLFVLPTLDRFVEKPSARRLAAVTGWLFVLHFVHDLMALAAGFTLVVFTLCAWTPGAMRNAIRLAPAALVALAAVASRAIQARLVQSGGKQVFDFAPLLYRIETLADALFAGTGLVSFALFLLAAVPVALFVAARVQTASTASTGPSRWRFRFEILAAAFLLFYFIAPTSIEWTASTWAGVGGQLSMRFLPLAWSLFAVASAPRDGSAPRLAKAALCLAAIAPVLVAWPEFAASDRTYRDLDRLAAHIERGSAQILLELGPRAPDALFTAAPAGGYLVANLGGRSFFDYTRSPASPVIQRPETQWTEPYERIETHPFALVPPHDLARFRYLILHSSDPALLEIAARVMTPEARVVTHEGELTLLESTLPQVPIDAPNDPYPPPHAANLGERIQAFAKSVQGSETSTDAK